MFFDVGQSSALRVPTSNVLDQADELREVQIENRDNQLGEAYRFLMFHCKKQPIIKAFLKSEQECIPAVIVKNIIL